MRTWPEAASVTMAAIKPSASNPGWKARPRSTSWGVLRSEKGSTGAMTGVSEIRAEVQKKPKLATRTLMHHLQKAVAIAGIGFQRAGKSGGDRLYPGLANPAHRHALMLGLDQDGHAAWSQRGLDRFGYLGGQCFLGLQAPGEDLDHARNFRDPEDASVRQVGNMRHSQERCQMMLAM